MRKWGWLYSTLCVFMLGIYYGMRLVLVGAGLSEPQTVVVCMTFVAVFLSAYQVRLSCSTELGIWDQVQDGAFLFYLYFSIYT